MSPELGEIYEVDFGFAGKRRPMIVVSRFEPGAPRALAVCVPVAGGSRPSRYEIPLGGRATVCEALFRHRSRHDRRRVPRTRSWRGAVSAAVLGQIRAASASTFELPEGS